MTLELIAGWAALVAAAFTVVGAATLMLFFSRGQPWGTRNDVASIILMLATIPVALAIAGIEAEGLTSWGFAVGLVGVAGMAAASAFQLGLVMRIRTYEQLLPWTLGAGAVVGLWYLLAGVLGLSGVLPAPLPALAIASGAGYVAISYGFLVGNQRHPLSVVGGIVLLIASTAFLAWLGLDLLRGEIAVPALFD